jgi:hypothetical protein
VEDPTRPFDDRARHPFNNEFQHFVRDLTHAVLEYLEGRAFPLAQWISRDGGDPSQVVVLAVETLRSIADGFEAGGSLS